MEELEREIKHLIVESLNLDGVAPESIDSTAPLFGAGLGLDSIDALELAMALRKKYGVRTTADDARTREVFSSVRSLAAFVLEERRRALAG